MKSLLTRENERNLRALVTETIRPMLAAAVEDCARLPSDAPRPSIAEASLALLACATLEPDAGARETLRETAQEGLVMALETDPSNVSLATGASGLLATFRVASESFDVDLDDSVRSTFFDATLRHLDLQELEWAKSQGSAGPAPPELEQTYDLLYGYGGVLLSTQGESVTEASLVRARCAAFLRRHVRWSEHLAYFEAPTRNDAYGDGAWINLGFAHGLVGLLTPLARDPELQDIAQGIGRLLLQLDEIRAQREPTAPHAYPIFMPLSAVGDIESWWSVQRTETRFGWCYGDAGVALALARTAPLLSSLDFEGALSRLVASCSERHTGRVDPGVVDATFCHGSSGNMHCLAELYRATRDDSLLGAINYWAEDVLTRHARGELCEVSLRDGSDLDVRYSLLNGIPSLVCPIASTIGAIDGTWDHALGLS